MSYIELALTGILVLNAGFLFIGLRAWYLYKKNKPKVRATFDYFKRFIEGTSQAWG